MTCTVILSFWRKRGFGGPPPENCSIFEALGLQFWRFLKQIRKPKLDANCLYIQLQKWLSFHTNNYFITQILSENIKILTGILPDFCLSFTLGGGGGGRGVTRNAKTLWCHLKIDFYYYFMTFKHRTHSWSLVVIRSHSWSFVVTRGHSWSLVVIRGHSWPLVVIRGHSWSLVCTFRQDP